MVDTRLKISEELSGAMLKVSRWLKVVELLIVICSMLYSKL